MFSKKKFMAIVALFSIFLVTGCQSSAQQASKSDKRPFLSLEQVQKEYKDSIKKLSWPKGYVPPSSLENEEPDTSYQEGYGDTVASNLFECAWSKQWLKTYASNEKDAQEAIKELEKVPSMSYMSKERADDSVRRYFKENLDKAKLGDPSGIQEHVSLNCPE